MSHLLVSTPVPPVCPIVCTLPLFTSLPLAPHLCFLPNLFLDCVWWCTQSQCASWANRGHISLPGNTMPLWKCSVNYWAMNKHPLCHFWLSYLRRTNGCDAWLLSAQGQLISAEIQQYTRGQMCHCWIVGVLHIVAFSLQMKKSQYKLSWPLVSGKACSVHQCIFSVQPIKNKNE